MKCSTIILFVFFIFNILCIVATTRAYWKENDLVEKRRDGLRNYLRLSSNSTLLIEEDENVVKEKKFSIVIVTHKEPLLEKTVLNILEKTPENRLQEIIIIDDINDPPITWNPDPSRVRIIRSEERLGLIKARIKGGNAALGDFIVFIDAHCRVNSNWLETPHRLLEENNRTIVNFVDFIMDEDFNVKPASSGIGSSATILTNMRQVWGGGSYTDDLTPITMGMFAITRYWWSMGQMDPALEIWGGENVEISFRTWLCGGRIVVARDSYVAHYFRKKPGYSYDGSVVTNNYIRIAHTWLDEPSLKLFYKSNNLEYKEGVIHPKAGDISDRLKLKEELKCKPFQEYLKMFPNRTFCSVGDKTCGKIYSVRPNDITQPVDVLF